MWDKRLEDLESRSGLQKWDIIQGEAIMDIAVTTLGICFAFVYLIMAAFSFIRGEDKKAAEEVMVSILIVIVTWVLHIMLIDL